MLRGKFTAPNSYIRKKEMSQIKDLYSPFRINKKFEQKINTSILKSRDITLPTKVRLVKAMVFPVVICGSESWTVKTAEHRRIDAFELWC